LAAGCGGADKDGRRRHTLYSPSITTSAWSRTPFPDNRIPVNRRSPLTTYLYSVTPLPTRPERNPLVTSNYFFGPSPNLRDDYTQDNYKLSTRLTLNLGLRWEIHPAFHEADRLSTGFDPASRSIVNGRGLEDLYKLRKTTPEIVGNFTRIGVRFATPEQVGLPPKLIEPDYWDVRPRAGFAYKLAAGKRSTVLRGGFALYTFPNPLRNFNARTRSNAPFNATFSTSITSAAQTPDGRPNWGLRSVPAVIAGVNSRDAIDPSKPGGVTRGGFRTSYFDPEQPSTRSQQWNLTLEREVTESAVLRFNPDFFSVLNNPGTPQPSNTSGIISLQNSANSPRELQLTLRLTW